MITKNDAIRIYRAAHAPLFEALQTPGGADRMIHACETLRAETDRARTLIYAILHNPNAKKKDRRRAARALQILIAFDCGETGSIADCLQLIDDHHARDYSRSQARTWYDKRGSVYCHALCCLHACI